MGFKSKRFTNSVLKTHEISASLSFVDEFDGRPIHSIAITVTFVFKKNLQILSIARNNLLASQSQCTVNSKIELYT